MVVVPIPARRYSGNTYEPGAPMTATTTREERIREFVQEALAADVAVADGAAVYRAEDVHAWLDRLARNSTKLPGPSRGAP